MDSDTLLRADQGNVATLTLHRPEVMNAINLDMLEALREEIEGIRSEPAVRVVIITGAGQKAFCAGADLEERASFDEAQVKEFLSRIGDLFRSIESLDRPVIAAINGVALGGGTELTLACDIRIASVNATLGLTETHLAVIPGAGGTQRLPRLVGPGKAKELIFTGRKIQAGEALDIGLVNQVHEADALLAECRKMAKTITKAGPIAIAQAKYAIDHGLDTDLESGLAIESEAYGKTIPTADRLEGLAAFREKRTPVYKGK
jgi:enoyl-CoA hydratase/carnithine racemase